MEGININMEGASIMLIGIVIAAIVVFAFLKILDHIEHNKTKLQRT